MAAWLVSGCGDLILRPLDLTISGVSGRAEKLVIGVYPKSSGQTCQGVGLGNVQSLSPPTLYIWQRGQMDRATTLPPVEEEGLTIVVYTEDANATPIQFVCEEIDYADLEAPEVQLQLSTRVPTQ
jgi:hypothetical protein